MAWINDPEATYTFTIARLLEGFLTIERLTVSTPGGDFDMILGGVDQAIQAIAHPGESVGVSMTVKNNQAMGSQSEDNFKVIITIGGSPQESPEMFLALNQEDTFSPGSFIMPDNDVPISVETYHEEIAI